MTDNETTTTEPTGGESEPPLSSSRPWRRLDLVIDIVGWATVAVLAWVTLSRWFAITVPARITIVLQALTPIVYLPVYAVAVAAFVRRRWVLGAAAVVLVLVHLASVYPALGRRGLPSWAATAPRITVLEANVYDQNASPDAAATKILSSGADALALVEIDSRLLAALRSHGLERLYPYSTVPAGRYRTDGVWSKVPISGVRFDNGAGGMPMATLDVGGRPLTLAAVHVENATRSRATWYEDFADIKAQMTTVTGPLALVGDYNATRWNPPFGDLLAAGLHDAHESVGQGLSRSWPNLGFPVPVMRLDHALVNDKVGVVSVRDVDIPGSDHIGFLAALAVDQ